jgi:hypothetical protein
MLAQHVIAVRDFLRVATDIAKVGCAAMRSVALSPLPPIMIGGRGL